MEENKENKSTENDVDKIEKDIEKITISKINELGKQWKDEIVKDYNLNEKNDKKGVGFNDGEVKETFGKQLEKAARDLFTNKTDTVQFLSKANNETNNSEGKYTVFTEKGSKIIETLPKDTVARFCTPVYMNHLTMDFPKITATPTVYATPEQGNLSATQLAFGTVQLAAKDLDCSVIITRNLLEDSNYPLEPVIERMTEVSYAEKLNRSLLTGYTENGVTFAGIINASGVNTVSAGTAGNFSTSASALKLTIGDEMLQLQTKIMQQHVSYNADAMYFMEPSVLEFIRLIRSNSGTGDYIFNSYNPLEGFAGTLWGKPVVLVNEMNSTSITSGGSAFVFYGALKNVYYGSRQDLRMEITKDGVINGISLRDKKSVAYLFDQRCDFVPQWGEAFSKWCLRSA